MGKSFQEEMFELIKSMTGETNILAVPKIFLELTGDLENGTFLSQLVYLSDKGIREDGFIYKTIDEWKNELYMSEYSVRKAKKVLEEMGLIETKVMKANGNPTVHYKINKDALVDSILSKQSSETSISQKPNSESKVSITQTTTETTTNKKEDIKEKNPDDSLTVVELPLKDGTLFAVTESMLPSWELAYQGINIKQELVKMKCWLLASPKNLKTKRGINKFIVNWLGRAKPQGYQQPYENKNEKGATTHNEHSANQGTGNPTGKFTDDNLNGIKTY